MTRGSPAQRPVRDPSYLDVFIPFVIVFGMQPRVTGTSNARVAAAIGLPAGRRSERDVGFHIEAFYTFRLNDHIAITPGFFWLTAPNMDGRNPDTFVGVVRTSFLF